MSELKDVIVDALKEVYDPEIPINIYDLGLIYDIKDNGGNIRITMTFTSPTCPTGDYIVSMVENAVKSILGVKDVEIEVTFSPPWTPDRVSMEAKEELGFADNNDIKTVQNVFSNDSNPEKERLCYKCSASEKDKPLVEIFYKGDKLFSCSKCF